MQWVHYTKICSSSAQGPYLSAETYKPIEGGLTWEVLEDDCEYWAESVNGDHLVGHGGSCKFIVVDAPPTEWLDKQINRVEASIKSQKEYLKTLKYFRL